MAYDLVSLVRLGVGLARVASALHPTTSTLCVSRLSACASSALHWAGYQSRARAGATSNIPTLCCHPGGSDKETLAPRRKHALVQSAQPGAARRAPVWWLKPA